MSTQTILPSSSARSAAFPVAPASSIAGAGFADDPAEFLSSTDLAPHVREEVEHMRRRLFRALDEPGQRLIAVDCWTMTPVGMRQILDRFSTTSALRQTHNLVLAITPEDGWSTSETAEIVNQFKSVTFERGFDGKVARLLMHHRAIELNALAHIVQQQGGLLTSRDLENPHSGLENPLSDHGLTAPYDFAPVKKPR